MKKILVSAFALMMGALVSNGAMATVPDLIPIQGVLADDVGAPIDGPTDIAFALYAAETGGSALWTDAFADVDVVEGFFTVYLGSDTALDFSTLLTNPQIWLGINVESDGEMDRIQLAAVPFAIEAQVCQAVGSLTESDINTNFSPVAHNHDAAYAAIGHNHDAAYAPISHTHAWTDITSGMPAGFADGTDDVDDTVSWAEISGIVGTTATTVAAGNHTHVQAGAKSGTRVNGFTITTTTASVATVATTIPAAGYVVLVGSAEFSANTTAQYIYCCLMDGTTSILCTDWDPGDNDGWYDQRQEFTTSTSATAGAHTYGLSCDVSSGTAPGYWAQVTAMYFPTTL